MKQMILLATTLTIAAYATGNESSDWASSYAEQAIEYQKMNIAQSCGYSEDRWHTDFEGHKLFAETIGRATAEAENKVREIAIEQCRNAWLYADQGVSQNEENMLKNCGKSGAMWHSNKIRHFEWAMLQTPYGIAIHDQHRRALLALCKR